MRGGGGLCFGLRLGFWSRRRWRAPIGGGGGAGVGGNGGEKK